MAENQLPRKVYRVKKVDGKYVTCERILIGKNGSWYTYEVNGKTIKENGMYWSDTVMDALRIAATNSIHCAALPMIYPEDEQRKCLCDLLEEAFEWGKLVGEITPAGRELAATLPKLEVR